MHTLKNTHPNEWHQRSLNLYISALFFPSCSFSPLFIPPPRPLCVWMWCTRPRRILRDIEIAAEKMKRPSCVFRDIFGGHLSRLKFADTNARSAAVCQGSPPQLWIIIGVFFCCFYSFSFQLRACRKRDGFDPCGSWDAEQDQRRSLLAYGETRRLRGSLRYS